MLIIGVDPGKVTGLSYSFVSGDEFRFSFSHELDAYSAVYEVWYYIDGFADPEITVACERFDIDDNTHKKARQYEPLDVTGALLYKCMQYGHKFVQYGRADAKNFGTDRKLKVMGMWMGTPDGHANDSSRQIVLHLAKIGRLPRLDLA